ncbi:DUF885 domain-containing protein [soil metagenome]
MRYLSLLLVLSWLMIGCTSATREDPTSGAAATVPGQSFSALLENYFEERLQLHPFEATAIADPRYNDQLPNDLSQAHRQQLRAFYTKYLGQLDQIDSARLEGQERLSYGIFRRDMQMNLEGLTFHTHLMPINQFWSLPLTLAQYGSGASNQPFRTVQDYENFLGRIRGFTEWTDTAIVNMRRGLARGITYPRVVMEKTLPQLRAVATADPTKSVYYGPISKLPESFSSADRERLTTAYTAAIREQVVPAYQKLHDFIQNEYLPKARTTHGISAIPRGPEYYQYLIRYWTTTNLTPDQIFETGQREVARIRQEMEQVKQQVGFQGDLQAFFRHVNTNPKFNPFQTEEEVLNAYRAIEQRMQPQLNRLFNLVPKSAFEIRQTEKFREASASAEYNPPAPDGSRPGIFYVPIINPRQYNAVGMESLFLHEAIPGHHYQISIQQEQQDIPRFRQYSWYGAYGEGWALYSESLGRELGLYTDPYQYFGRLSGEMHRAIRLVVDVGMHAKGWTREQAIKYSLENELSSEEEAIAEIERYMVIPGQALSYKIGEIKIRELRQRAERELGTKFSVSAFHDEVLQDGGMPLEVLEAKINDWIERQKKA